MMVGMAVLVVGYSYGARTTHPARMTDIATTTMTKTTKPAAANLVQGGVRTGDTSLAEMEKEDCYRRPCNKNKNKEACLSGLTEGCHWYPMWSNTMVPGGGTTGGCSSCSGVNCGKGTNGHRSNGHRAINCSQCPQYGGTPYYFYSFVKEYCYGECKWGDENFLGNGGRCVSRSWTKPPIWSF